LNEYHCCFSITNPDEILCTLKITMPLQDWRILHEQLAHSSTKVPAWAIRKDICDLILKAQESFVAKGRVQAGGPEE